MTETSTLAPQLRNLRRLAGLRAIEVAGQAAAIAIAMYGIGMALPTAILLALTGGLALAALFTWWRTRQPWPVTEAELAGHLLLDIGVLTGLLYFTGGSTNPFITLYLLPLSIAAAILPAAYTWAVAGATLACYTFLLFMHLPLPQGPGSFALLATLFPGGLPSSLPGGHDAHGAQADFNLHVLGMWFNFALSVVLIAWFVARMAQSLRERDRRLAAAREEALRNEQLVALGTLAAGAAHELGTPLSTMAVIAKELERDHANDPVLAEDLRLLRAQTERCKAILTNLTARAEAATRIACEDYLRQLIERWQLLRPQIKISTHFAGAQPVPELTAERTLDQALLNLFNNAADVSPQGIEVEGRWDTAQLTLEIRDHGQGISAEVAARAGEAFFTTKGPEGGLGIGLFLANATIERFGGTVNLFNREGGGACVRVTLPLQPSI
ncbi:MAG: HAMP domain-containing histidine kinase [Hydrogenophilales bacterium]|nr:HAMP domain-containing histidine kinase [Hydrogenophilales bacterium]